MTLAHARHLSASSFFKKVEEEIRKAEDALRTDLKRFGPKTSTESSTKGALEKSARPKVDLSAASYVTSPPRIG
jgi:hypothetical protein